MLYAIKHPDERMGWANERYPLDQPCHVPQLFDDMTLANLFISNNGLFKGPGGGYRIVPVFVTELE